MTGWNPYTWEYWWVPHVAVAPLALATFGLLVWRDRRRRG
jgi:hypothetical protein